MTSLETLREFLGWCAVINVGLLMIAAVFVVPMRGAISQIHARMFELSKEDLSRAYFQYLAYYKITILVFNIAPYIALVIIT